MKCLVLLVLAPGLALGAESQKEFVLESDLAAQGERRRWILEHWPHVVEYQELNAGLAATARSPLVPALG